MKINSTIRFSMDLRQKVVVSATTLQDVLVHEHGGKLISVD